MSKEKGREQVFQLGVGFVNDSIEKELIPRIAKMVWDEDLKDIIREYFVNKYTEVKQKMVFLERKEYPRVSLYMDNECLKVNVQGWMHTLENTIFIGSYQYNRDTYYDYYFEEGGIPMENENKKDLDNILIRYGDLPKEVYRRSISDAEGYGVKWKVGLDFYNRLGDLLIIDPLRLLEVKEEEVKEEEVKEEEVKEEEVKEEEVKEEVIKNE